MGHSGAGVRGEPGEVEPGANPGPAPVQARDTPRIPAGRQRRPLPSRASSGAPCPCLTPSAARPPRGASARVLGAGVAQAECRSYGPGTHLAWVRSAVESGMLAIHVSQRMPAGGVWIGLHRPPQVSARRRLPGSEWLREGRSGSAAVPCSRSAACAPPWLPLCSELTGPSPQGGGWTWTGDSGFSFSSWEPGEPGRSRPGAGKHCALMWSGTGELRGRAGARLAQSRGPVRSRAGTGCEQV